MFDQVLDKIAHIQEAIHPIVNGDYLGENGLYCCGVCGKPKQTRIPKPVFQNADNGDVTVTYPADSVMVVPSLCNCDKARIAAERSRKELEAERERITKLRQKCFLSDSMHAQVFSFWDARTTQEKRVLAICERYVKHFKEMLLKNQGLLLFGPPGTGKTFAAMCIANALLDSGYTVATTCVSYLMKLRDRESEEGFIDVITSVRLMILDDLGAERSSDYGKERLYSVIDARYRSCQPMIITTNLTMAQMKEPKAISDARVYDRILEKCYPVSFEGLAERRKLAAVDNFKTMRALLEG